jgi:hypothetical protein
MEKSAARIHHPNSGNNYGVQNRFAADYVVIDSSPGRPSGTPGLFFLCLPQVNANDLTIGTSKGHSETEI